MASEDLRRENLEGKTIVELNQLCRDHSIKGVIGRPKGDMVNYMVAFNENRPVEQVMAEQGRQAPPVPPASETPQAGESGGSGWQNLDEVQAESEQAAPQTQSEPTQEEASEEETTTVAQT